MLLAELSQRFDQVEVGRQLTDCSRFAAWNDQSLQVLQLFSQAHGACFDTQVSQNDQVFGEISLKCEDANLHKIGYQPLPAIKSWSGIEEICRPTMGSPRLRLTSARILGSL